MKFEQGHDIPQVITDDRSSLKLYRDLSALGCVFREPALELMANKSFGSIREGFIYEFDYLDEHYIPDGIGNASIGDLLIHLKSRSLAIVDQVVPFLMAEVILHQRMEMDKDIPWCFLVESRHSDPRTKTALVTLSWPPWDSHRGCKIDAFRPVDSDLVLQRPLNHQSIKGGIFIFSAKITREN